MEITIEQLIDRLWMIRDQKQVIEPRETERSFYGEVPPELTITIVLDENCRIKEIENLILY